MDKKKKNNHFGSVADLHQVDADPDSTFYLVADPDPACRFNADPDPTFHFGADLDPDPTFQIKAQNHTFWLFICKLMWIRVQLVTLMRIRNQFITFMRIRILTFNSMRIHVSSQRTLCKRT